MTFTPNDKEPRVAARQEIERHIVTALVDAILSKGYRVAVTNGGDTFEVDPTADRAAILAGLFECDEETLHLYDKDRHSAGWFVLSYGNDGWDVVADYVANTACDEIEAEISPLIDAYYDPAYYAHMKDESPSITTHVMRATKYRTPEEAAQRATDMLLEGYHVLRADAAGFVTGEYPPPPGTAALDWSKFWIVSVPE